MSLFFIFFDNYSFYKNVLEVYPLEGINILYIISLSVVIVTFNLFLFTLISSKYTLKPILIIVLIISAFTSYFMNTYNVIIDNLMIQNSLQTDLKESLDLLSFKLLLYVVFLGLVPAYLVYRVELKTLSFKATLLSKAKVLLGSLIIIIIILLSFSKFYTSFLREHKPLRFYVNPTYWIYSIGEYISIVTNHREVKFKQIGLDAKISPINKPHKLVIMVVGEATRADHFSLNGYNRETNPLLKKENIINFKSFYSCGTSTAVSVPCMFSVYNRSDYTYKKGRATQNVLDVLNHTKQVAILWRDNNSDSKGVALRVPFEDFKYGNKNPICKDGECRDEGMLVGLDKYIEQHKNQDILIVLHQMGNHGPAYYKRYPKEFEKFKPVCKTNQLENCTKESITNAYDNALLYNDYFLSKVINLLKNYQNSYNTTMFYISDHGESLGENGLYLHGLPYFMAPDSQTHVASVAWFGENNQHKVNANKEYSQDNLFHTLLGLFNVKSEIYNKKMDIFDNF